MVPGVETIRRRRLFSALEFAPRQFSASGVAQLKIGSQAWDSAYRIYNEASFVFELVI
jgi:hypothetical protein